MDVALILVVMDVALGHLPKEDMVQALIES